MNLGERIDTFAATGKVLRDLLAGNDSCSGTKLFSASNLNNLIATRYLENEWFTPENVRMALGEIAATLTRENLADWCGRYSISEENREPQRVGVVMAGNIPLVGFHDMLCVLITGNILLARTSSRDASLTAYIASVITTVNRGFKPFINIAEKEIKDFDAVIATGSDNSSRYFEYYFGRYPHIIRKNRNSAGIIRGNETDEEIKGLGRDIFSYFGLGCRNISKLFIPDGYNPILLTDRWGDYATLMKHRKYANNYDFNKAVYIVNRREFKDAGFLILTEDASLSSPVSVLHYETYTSEEALRHQLDLNIDRIQCITGRKEVPFGKAQSPYLWDYADGIDTIEFLLKKKQAGIM